MLIFSLNIGDTSKYGKYYNPYFSGGGIPWTLYPTRIRIRVRRMGTMVALSFIPMGSDRIYTSISIGD